MNLEKMPTMILQVFAFANIKIKREAYYRSVRRLELFEQMNQSTDANKGIISMVEMNYSLYSLLVVLFFIAGALLAVSLSMGAMPGIHTAIVGAVSALMLGMTWVCASTADKTWEIVEKCYAAPGPSQTGNTPNNLPGA